MLTNLFPSNSGEIEAVPKIMERGNARTVLVVEDVEEISSQMATMLRGKGHRVLFATDAGEAIKEAEREPPALILTDLDLPSFDSLLNLVRDHEQLRKVDVVVIDINHPHLTRNDVKVLSDFDQLDNLLG
jgi:CheY-like chemotaxis protein